MNKKIEKGLTVYDGNNAYVYNISFKIEGFIKSLTISKNNYFTNEAAHYTVKRHGMFSGSKMSSIKQMYAMPTYKTNGLSVILVLKRYKDGV